MVRENSSTLINNNAFWQTKREKCINCVGTTENDAGSMNGQNWEDKPVTWKCGNHV